MAHFLKDQHLRNLTIRAENLIQIGGAFADRMRAANASLAAGSPDAKRAFLTYVVRFDGKGYRVFSIDEMLQYFEQAKFVERIVFTLQTAESLQSQGNFGTYAELRLDIADLNGTYLKVTDDDRDWVDASFASLQDWLVKCRNRHGLVRTAWTPFVVQIIGIALIFIFSLLIASKVSPSLRLENAFLLSFLFAFLIFSNTWTFLSAQIGRLINFAFPNVKFSRPRKDHIHWFAQTIVSSGLIAGSLYVLGLAASYLTDWMAVIVARN